MHTVKKIALILIAVVCVTSTNGYLFRQQLWDLVVYVFSRDTFINDDTDSFDPGLAVGEHFPAIKALYKGRTVSDVRDFAHHKGMIFIANRSADW